MKTCIVIVAVFAVLCGLCEAQGRAFPIEAENIAIIKLSSVNGKLEYDVTNYLVDLSGRYATCDNVGTYGIKAVREVTSDGQEIAAIVDATYGERSDVNAVVGYIKDVIDRWVQNKRYLELVKRATRFGCSVRPGCEGLAVVACLFSPASPQGVATPEPIIRPGSPVAFTRQQYLLAEGITHTPWGFDHFLENLSAYETDCEMIINDKWPFGTFEMTAKERGMNLVGVYGHSRNLGETEPALVEILEQIGPIPGRKVGCSLISDCVYQLQMYVVVSCLYEV